MHFGDFREVVGTVLGDEFLGGGVNGRGSPLGKRHLELLLQAGQAGDELVAGEN